MRISNIKKDVRFDVLNSTQLGIQLYGNTNDYPQQVSEIVNLSGTGKVCLNTYAKFIKGKGFLDAGFGQLKVGGNDDTSNDLLFKLASDFALYGGFAVHVNYTSNFTIKELQHVPFETLRFSAMDEKGDFSQVALHSDWGRRFTKLKKWKKEDIEFIDIFNPDPEAIFSQMQKAGSWEKYKGQIYFYSNEGDKVYPLPIFDSVLTDMSTEEGLSNLTYRAARNNMITAGVIVDIIAEEESDEEFEKKKKEFLEFQGDEEAGKLIYVQVKSKEEVPQFVKFDSDNFDKNFDTTTNKTKDKIGRAFTQPPILRAEDVGANFGSDLMENAYNFYNSITENERTILSDTFKYLFQFWYVNVVANYTISSLTYLVQTSLAAKISPFALREATNIVLDTVLSDDKKRGILKIFYGMSDDDLDNIFGQQQTPQT